MQKKYAIEVLKELTKTAGAERLRALFTKYRMSNLPLRVSGVITGMKLHGEPFFNDLTRIAVDARRSQVGADGTETGTDAGTGTGTGTTGGGMSAWDYIMQGIQTGASAFGSIWGAISGNGSPQTVPTTNAAGQVVYVPVGGSSNSSSNTALWVILAVVGIAVVGLVIFLAMKKK
ncbi:MAG: hypothetical protein LBU42_10135 [Prevotellaceae bacterium]|jgi:hypothetical protein|nr:hypothetical protein [Prevotellaceae bacterium]